MIFEKFFPDRIVDSVQSIDFEAEFKRGVRAVIFDIDNTLVPHDAPATEETKKFFEGLREIGLKTCLISNNGEQRVMPFAERVGSLYLANAGKPGLSAYTKAMAILHTDVSNTLFVGDQLLTDIYGAKRLGMQNICTKPVDPKSDIPRVKFKRKIEKIILKRYRKASDTKNT